MRKNKKPVQQCGASGNHDDSRHEPASSAHIRPVSAVALERIRPHPSNARTHSKKQIRQIADSIEAFGFASPVLIDEHGTLLAGHGRLEAAKLLAFKTVPAIVVDGLSEARKCDGLGRDVQSRIHRFSHRHAHACEQRFG